MMTRRGKGKQWRAKADGTARMAVALVIIARMAMALGAKEKMNIPILTKLQEARVDRDACLVEGIILTSGISENGTYYSPEVVEESAPIFKGVQCYADHPRPSETERSVRDVVGVIEEAWHDDGRIRATMRLSRAHDWLLTMIGEDLVGDLSINALGRTKVVRRDGRVVREVTEISKAYSVDFVTDAAAGGRVDALLRESAGYAEGLRLLERLTIDELREARPDLAENLVEQVREELLSEDEEGRNEVERLQEEIERRRIALKREQIASRLIDASNLPSRVKVFVLAEALALQVETEDSHKEQDEAEDSYREAVESLTRRHRRSLADLTVQGVIQGMGSEKETGPDKGRARRETLRLMGIGR